MFVNKNMLLNIPIVVSNKTYLFINLCPKIEFYWNEMYLRNLIFIIIMLKINMESFKNRYHVCKNWEIMK